MAMIIRASSLFTKRYLKLTDWGVKFMEAAAFGGVRKFTFSQIDHILLSADHTLSFQVGQKSFSIPTKPGNAKHQAVIRELVQAVGGREPSTGGFPVGPAKSWEQNSASAYQKFGS